MKNQIIIHASGKQTRIALLENNELAQLFIESPENQRTVGDIYVAEVRKVMGGIRAAFIDMNTPKDAFLHFSDLGEHLDDYLIMLNGQDALPQDALKKLREYRERKDDSQNTKNGTNAEEQNLLGALLKPGQKVLVQIVKEPIGSKGPRVSTNISLAGRFLVLIPMGDYVAVSKRIRSYKERRKLRQTVAEILPEGFGVIVRTVAEGQDLQLIENDLKEVLEKWNNIVKNLEGAKPPTLLHRDLEMTESLVRDLFAKDFDRILVDDQKMHKTLKDYVSRIAPGLLPNIELYKGSTHIFDHMKIMQDVESVFSPRVKMPSGGYLIFEQTEAMYVVDVNSGRYAAKKAQEDNSLKTNLESAREIAKQLRLRDIGGIIVVDFIDLRDEVNRKKVYDELKKEFRKDRAKTNVLPMSDFGLVQITRQRIRPSVVKSVSRVCPMCGGSGSIVSQNTLLSDIESWLSKFRHTTSFRSVDLHINPYMKGMLTKGWVSQHFKWMLKYRLRIGLIEDVTLSMNDYKFTLAGSDVDITETIMMDQSIDSAIKAAEQRIAELESEHKRDSTTLDIYKKERSDANQDRQTSGRQQDRGSSQRSPDRSADNRQGDNKSTQTDSRDNRRDDNRSGGGRQQEQEQQSAGRDTRSKDNDNNDRNAGRRNQKISKYYKKQDEEGAEAEKAAAPSSAATSNQQQKPASDNVKPSKASETTTEDDAIPEELSHLRSAWDVAREYRRKRDLEPGSESKTDENTATADKSTDESTISHEVEGQDSSDASTAKSDASVNKEEGIDTTDSNTSGSKSKDTTGSEDASENSQKSQDAEVSKEKSDNTESKPKTGRSSAKSKSTGTGKSPTKSDNKPKSPAKAKQAAEATDKDEQRRVATSIVQSLVASKPSDDAEGEDKPKKAPAGKKKPAANKDEATKSDSDADTKKKAATSKAASKKSTSGKKAKTAEEVAKKKASKTAAAKKAPAKPKKSDDAATDDQQQGSAAKGDE